MCIVGYAGPWLSCGGNKKGRVPAFSRARRALSGVVLRCKYTTIFSSRKFFFVFLLEMSSFACHENLFSVD